jgi:hypothetical protein
LGFNNRPGYTSLQCPHGANLAKNWLTEEEGEKEDEDGEEEILAIGEIFGEGEFSRGDFVE